MSSFQTSADKLGRSLFTGLYEKASESALGQHRVISSFSTVPGFQASSILQL